jgi:hypothetical protein
MRMTLQPRPTLADYATTVALPWFHTSVRSWSPQTVTKFGPLTIVCGRRLARYHKSDRSYCKLSPVVGGKIQALTPVAVGLSRPAVKAWHEFRCCTPRAYDVTR